jgi:tRNA(Ile)-lysidine synthase
LDCIEGAPARAPASPDASPDDEETIDLSRAGTHALPQWGGTFEVSRVARGGVAAAVLRACTLRARRGGEQFQAKPRSTPRSLKKQYQAAGLPAWQRDGPLVYAGDQLLFVPGLGFDARALASHGAGRGLAMRWCPLESAA